MQVRSGGSPCRSHIADDVALIDAFAGLYAFGEPVQMVVGGLVTGRMTYTDIIAEAALAVGAFNHAIARRLDRRTAACSEIDAFVGACIA